MAKKPTLLKSVDDEAVTVQEGESCNIVVAFKDMDGVAIPKSALLTLTATLFDYLTAEAINSRDGQDILDANQGSVASDGTLTFRLGPDDNPIVGDPETGLKETHVVIFEWTWDDGVEIRTGKSQPLGISVEQLAAVT